MSNELTGLGTDVLLDSLIASEDMGLFLQRLVTIAVSELDRGVGDVHCSVTVLRARRPITVVSSDPETAAMDEVQYATKQGPCLEAVRSGQLIEVKDLRTESRWPRYIAAAAETPMRSVAVPIPILTSGAAALNCYSSSPGRLPELARESLLDFANTAARALTLSVQFQTKSEESADLAAALESRTAIKLAAGIIMTQTGCDQKRAVDILLRASANRNVKLRDVALSVVGHFNGSSPTTYFETPRWPPVYDAAATNQHIQRPGSSGARK